MSQKNKVHQKRQWPRASLGPELSCHVPQKKMIHDFDRWEGELSKSALDSVRARVYPKAPLYAPQNGKNTEKGA